MNAFKRLSQHDHTASESSNVGVAGLSCRPPAIHAIEWDPIGAAWEDIERTNLGSSWITGWTKSGVGLQASHRGTDLRVGFSILTGWEATLVGRAGALGALLGDVGSSNPLESAGPSATTKQRAQYVPVISKVCSEMARRAPEFMEGGGARKSCIMLH
jgi:hypothetical protein